MMKDYEDPSWQHYSHTVLLLENGTIDLRRDVDPEVRHLLRSAGLTHEFAVITAWNPFGVRVQPERNLEHSHAFEAELSRMGVDWIPVTGSSPDGDHSEPGYAIRVSEAAATDLARWAKQSAYFWFDGNVFWIHGACVASDPIRLPIPPDERDR